MISYYIAAVFMCAWPAAFYYILQGAGVDVRALSCLLVVGVAFTFSLSWVGGAVGILHLADCVERGK